MYILSFLQLLLLTPFPEIMHPTQTSCLSSAACHMMDVPRVPTGPFRDLSICSSLLCYTVGLHKY